MNRHISDEVLSAYLDGEIDTSREPQLEAHRASCTDCKARFHLAPGFYILVHGTESAEGHPHGEHA